MNLRSWTNKTAGAVKRPAATAGIFGQSRRGGLLYACLIMPLPVRLKFFALCAAGALAAPWVATAQTSYYGTNGTEYALIGSLPTDQMFPDVALATNGGIVTWQDNITDGSGWGISARRLDATLSGTLGTFRVNAQGTNNQENPRVALLKNGGAAFAWQGGPQGFQHIYARFMTRTNTWLTTTDLLASTSVKFYQSNPALAVLNNSSVVVVWSSYNQAGSNSMQDVYAKILSPSGVTISNEFRINQFTNFNQRSPGVAALKGGGFVVTWVSEQQRVPAMVAGSGSPMVSNSLSLLASVDIYARLFKTNGAAVGNEFLVNADAHTCANPAVAAASDGSFLIGWTSRDTANPQNSLDIRARSFTSAGVGGPGFYVNSHLAGDQYVPRISALGLDYFVTWTSLGQDGSREGVFAQFVHSGGSLVGGEFRVNTTALGQQLQPTVASDGSSQFLVVWTGFTGLPNTFDLFAQRYLNVSALLPAMPAPFVWVPFVTSNGIYQPRLVVSWSPLLGLSISNYEVYVDGVITTNVWPSTNQWAMTAANGLKTNSWHSFSLDYVTTAGQRSPLSPSTSASTWQGGNWGGVPYEWMAGFYGSNTNLWPSAGSQPSGGGQTLAQVFLSGGNPKKPNTWLQSTLASTAQGMFLSWNTLPGATYQVQATTNFASWANLGPARFAAGTVDSIYVGGSPAAYYRVVLQR